MTKLINKNSLHKTVLKQHACIAMALVFIFFLSIKCTSANLVNNTKINQIEHLLIFYPHKGEKELQALINNKAYLSQSNQYKVHYLKGLLAYKKSEIDTAIAYLQKALFYLTSQNNVQYISKSKLILGLVAEKVGDLDQALLCYYEVTETAEGERELGYAYLGVARCKRYLHGIMSGENYELNKGVELLKSLGKKEFTLYADFMDLALTNKGKEHKEKLKQLAKEYINIGINENASIVYKVLSHLYLKENKLDSAEHYVDIALPLTKTTYPTVSLTPTLYQIKGVLDYRRKNYKEAEVKFNHALALCDTFNQEGSKSYIYNSMAKLYSAVEDYKSAHKYKEKAEICEKERLNTINNDQIKLKNLSLNLKLVKEELKQKEMEEHLEEKKALLSILYLILAIVIIASTIVIIYMHKKKKLIRKQYLWQQKLDKEEYERQIQIVKTILERIGKKHSLAKITEEDMEELFSCLQDVPSPLDLFIEGYPELIEAVKKEFPQLTEGDYTYVALFYLGQEEKIIAYFKKVNQDTVQRVQRRIRARLGLKKGTDLYVFFRKKIDVEVDDNIIRKLEEHRKQLPINNPDKQDIEQGESEEDKKKEKSEERRNEQKEHWKKIINDMKKKALVEETQKEQE